MATKKINESPCVGDKIVFELEAFGREGRQTDPYSLNNISIHFVERNFAQDHKNLMHQTKFYDDNAYEVLEKGSSVVKEKIESLSPKFESYYKDLSTVDSIGSETRPIWVKDQCDPVVSKKRDGIFTYEWEAKNNVLAGDYIISWSWTAKEGEYERRRSTPFFLKVNKNKYPKPFEKSLDTEAKYKFLIDKFLPRMYKYTLNDKDLSPEVIKVMLEAAAKGFAHVEDTLEDLIECYDFRGSNESTLQLLANLFNMKLRGEDFGGWINQIGNAVPMLKQKGTQEGLEKALSSAGIKANKITKLWQIMPKVNWVDGFRATYDNQSVFQLSKNPIGSVKLELRPSNQEDYLELDQDFFMLSPSIDPPGKTLLIWNSTNISIFEGDSLKISYKYKEGEDEFEDYILSLPLMDDRDETEQVYPPKNWNMRLIAEDDPLFDVIIPERHPFADFVKFGEIRTTFLYSEKIYNMDTYSGSLRDSYEPCDIDKNFIDLCSYGQSSKFNIDLEIENLSNERIIEAKEIINEFTPFHATLHTMGITGINKDLIMSTEDIQVESDMENELAEEKVESKGNIVCIIEHDDGTEDKIEIEV